MSTATVCRDLAALRDQWLKSSLRDFDAAKAEELARVDRLEREYWDAWKRSKQDSETVTKKGRGKQDKPEQVEQIIQRKGQVGDPRFLAGIQWCVEQRCKILGLSAPEKRDITSDGEAIESILVIGGIDLDDI